MVGRDFGDSITIPKPDNDFVRSRAQTEIFRKTIRPLLDEIKAAHGESAKIHVFPAMPVSLAVDFGRILNNKSDLPLVIYDDAITKMQGQNAFNWARKQAEIIAEVQGAFDAIKGTVHDLAELGKEVLLLRRDEPERAKLFMEKAEAEAQAETEKQRADDAFKALANQVRGLDLVPIAKDILGFTPTKQNDTFVFENEATNLVIDGRKFHDSKNPKCRGSGAIDLVVRLTTRNVKGAVEYLLTKHPTEKIVADKTGAVHARIEAKVKSLDPKPRVLTMDDIPVRLWKPNPSIWRPLRDRLWDEQNISLALLRSLNKLDVLWAVDDRTLGVKRTGLNSMDTTTLGVTVMDLKAPELKPHLWLPQYGGQFWLGDAFDKADTVIAVANPLEALSYRCFYQMGSSDRNIVTGRELPSSPLIISVDAPLPPPGLIEQIAAHNNRSPKKKRFLLSTNTLLAPELIAKLLPASLSQNGEFADWFVIDPTKPDLLDEQRSKAWNTLLIDSKKALREQPRQAALDGPSR
ncbi:MAG TPA: SAVED domain-containing protein [Verrucomicrobiae bacterium]|nr:SAVED domain-containing protein [Verrucomicrobiae bacterium]